MPFELRVPPVGESITEVQIGEWLKQEGQSVRKDENLVLIESEKATLELPSPGAGVLASILKRRGEMARVGDVIGLIQEASVSDVSAPSTAASPATATAEPSVATPSAAAVVMPAAQRVLAEAGIPAPAVQGTGPSGRVTKEDALKAAAAKPAQFSLTAPTPPSTPISAAPAPVAPLANPAAAPTTPAPASPPAAVTASVGVPGREEEVVPMSPLRRTVARRLVEAQASMAMLTTFNEVDMSAAMALRKQYQEAFTARHGVKLGFMSMFVKAVIEALKDVPQLNAEVRDQTIVYRRYYDIGVAIGGGKGLVVPVLRNAERLGFAAIEQAIAEFAGRAKDGRIKPEELAGGTFTLSNGGIYGSLLSTPIINPPQSGILGMHTIQDRAVVVEGQIVVRPMMYVALTYDHRIVDGREAVTFLKRVKEIIEAPARMLIEA
ncbi:MAG: 2-oxoglutarate dehydrogenase complex dihydrolipoyllysine-residue succinyltransferase [Verrucomicrobiales bacterium]|nr:2-oxoglutarate dehydrogenase complex dihydrolipoyllysine-residue succinyltransferase [Verrucomicrobiales bacterium]